MKTPYQIGAEYALQEKVAWGPLVAAGAVLGGSLLRNVGWGAGIGGVMGAATAKPGERLKGFGQGALYGGLSGVGMSGLSAGSGLLRGITTGTRAAGQMFAPAAPASSKFLLGKAGLPKGMTDFHPGLLTKYLGQKGFGPGLGRLATGGAGVFGASMALPMGPKPDTLPMTNLPPGY